MPEKEIRPSLGEVWKKIFTDCKGRNTDEALYFIYEENRKLYKAWLRIDWKGDFVKENMIDGQNGWRRVYTPQVPMTEVFFK